MSRRVGGLFLIALSGMFTTACGDVLTPTAPQPVVITELPLPPTSTPLPKPSSDPIVGLYTLTLSVASGCDALPETVRNRAYSAAIDEAGPDGFLITLGDAVFLEGLICNSFSGLGCNQFRARRSGSAIEIDMVSESDDHGGNIVEQLPARTWVEIWGAGSGTANGSTIHAVLDGGIWYCPVERGYPFPCLDYVGCRTQDMRLTFTRR